MIVNASSNLPSQQFQIHSPVKSEKSSLDAKKQDADNNSQASSRQQTQDEIAEQRLLQKLKNLDREVRAHELAHVSVGGRYVTSGAQFQYQKGPDGRQYAVSGEVSIDTSEIPGDPQATLAKAQVVLRAALAPANPSAQDRRVAAQAVSTIQQARVEIALQSAQAAEDSKVGNQLDTFA